MKPRNTYGKSGVLTVGALCEALADGTIQATIEDGYYTFRNADLRRISEPVTITQLLRHIEDFKSKQLSIAS